MKYVTLINKFICINSFNINSDASTAPVSPNNKRKLAKMLTIFQPVSRFTHLQKFFSYYAK